ncbi:MAG: FUSC family protein [Actinomycetota bacterium]
MRFSLADTRDAAVTLVSMLLSFGSVLVLQQAFGLDDGLLVLSVALSMTLSRTNAGRSTREQLFGLVIVPVVALAAFGVGALLLDLPIAGSVLFIVAVSGAIWLRRFGPLTSRIGTFIAPPFIAVLITPAPAMPSGHGAFLPWAAVVAIIAAGWSLLTRLLAQCTGLLSPTRLASPAPLASPAREVRPRAPGERRLAPSTRMAIQLAAALAAAFLIGHLLLGQHWPWVVITAYVVTSGNRGRGDVVYKGVMRTVGALVGTAAATLLAGLFPPGDAVAIVGVFVALAIGLALRAINYSFWAASVTAALALLYGYFGEGGEQLLLNRIVGVLIGGVLAVVCAWFILPIRTRDVLRRRMFDSLAALNDVLGTARTDPERLPDEAARFRASLAAIDQLVPTLRAADVILRLRRVEQRHGHVVTALKRCAAPVETLAGVAPAELAEASKRIGQLSRRVGSLRRALAAHTDPEWAEESIAFGDTLADAALRDIDRVIVGWAT